MMSVPQMPARHEQDPYEQLKAKIRRHLKDKKLDDKILGLVRVSCDEALRGERIILSRVEHTRFIQLVSRDVLLEILAKL
jgi:hypothetical protein